MNKLEEVELVKITKKGAKISIEWTPDTDKYQLLGILRTYTKALEREITEEWEAEE